MINFSFLSTKRIPTALAVFGVLVLLGGLFLGTRGLDEIKKVFVKADQEEAPSSKVNLANITDTSFTVYWTTGREVTGGVFYGSPPELTGGIALDDRALTDPDAKYLTHFVRVGNLQPDTKYYFKVGSVRPSFGNTDDGGSPFAVSTGKSLASSVALDPVFGQARSAQKAPASGAIALWEAPGISPLATLVKTDGNYVLPIATARSQDLSQPIDPNSTPSETITIIATAADKATITCTLGKGDRPLPDVSLGQTLDCSGEPGRQLAEVATTSGQTQTTTQARFKVSPSPTSNLSSGDLKVNIVSGQSLSTNLPTISGKAGPKQVIKIIIHSETTYSGTVIAGPDGSWSWTPPTGLAPGEHTVTITVVNADGTTQTVSRTFFVSSDSPILPITSGPPSAQVSHFACVASACQLVSGSGPDTCTTDLDCPTATPSAPTPPETGSLDNIVPLLVSGLTLLMFTLALTIVRI